MHKRDSPPRRLLGAILSRIKILAKMDIAERRRPQDGRIKITVGDKELDLRVSILPTNHGQSVRHAAPGQGQHQGRRPPAWASRKRISSSFRQLIRRPNGIILVTGPTGSGKTTTLYAALNDLNRPDRKIITAEDPVEYYLPGINQVEVKHSIGLDFARIIRAMLRQAPNIILVGEMRDDETASMGIQASLTGHLVFSTLHTNDAPSAVTRMVDMGVPTYLVASSVIAVLAQRLVRVICPRCKQPIQLPESVLSDAGIPPKTGRQGNLHERQGLRKLQQERLPRPAGNFRADADQLQDSRADFQERLGRRDPQAGHDPGHENALRRWHPQGHEGRHHPGRGLSQRQADRAGQLRIRGGVGSPAPYERAGIDEATRRIAPFKAANQRTQQP